MAKEDEKLEENNGAMISDNQESNKEDESAGSKLLSTLIVLVIILIWLGAFCLAVKFDLGGFGSGVLAPVLKDVPVVNKILPDTTNSSAEDGYQFKTMDDAVARIKELEMQLDSQTSASGVDASYIVELEAEVERLKVFEKQQKDFAKQKKEFDENVVFNDNAPDITEYQKYYEQIDPDNAAEIYRQVVEQVQEDAKVTAAADRYAEMEASAAASILDQMTSADLDMVCKILAAMDAEKSGAILAAMDSNVAAKVTKRMLTMQ